MIDRKKPLKGRKGRNTFVTKSGQTIKIHRNLGERFQASRDARARRKAVRLAGMPKSPIKRFFYRLHPKRMYAYWFSREGGIMALKLAGIGIVAGFLLLVGVFAYFRKDLPDIKSISGDTLGGTIRYYDRTGKNLLWEDYEAVKRIPVEEKDISDNMRNATVAVEDKDFFKHGGFDVRGILRAGINDVFGSGGRQGGSTITQQLVKLNRNWTNEQTYTRKIKELIIAVELERSYSKQEILNGYLNNAPYGNVQYGVEVAARDYFQKSAKDLTIDEAAFLAAIPKAPSEYSPYGASFKEEPEYWKEQLVYRQQYILGLMYEQKMITKKEYDDAKKVDILAKYKTPKPKYEGITAPYFVETAKSQLDRKYGAETVQRGGWKVTTTLDLDLQRKAEEQVSKGLVRVKRQGGDKIAFAAEDVTNGQMVALVGNPVFDPNQNKGQVNYATTRLAPGSSVKAYDYAALIENTTNFGAGTVLYDTQAPLMPDYPCTDKRQPSSTPGQGGNCLWDYDRRYPGPITLRYALGASRNVPAVKAALIVGIPKVQETYKKLAGIPADDKSSTANQNRGNYKCYDDVEKTVERACRSSAGIGDDSYLKLDEHVHGYASLSRNGLNITQTYILKIEDSQNNVVDEWKPSKGTQAVRPDTAYIVSDMLADPNASYFTQKPHRYKGWKYSLKTGTTNDLKDGWLVGYTTRYAAGVWVGNSNNSALSGAMENLTQPIWQGWMNSVHDTIKPEERPKPAGVQTLPAFIIRNHVEYGTVEPSPANDLYPSWYKQPSKVTGSKKTIDIVSNKLATDCTPERARKVNTDTNANAFSGDKFVGGGANTEEQDDIHKCDDAKPTIQIISAPTNCTTSCSVSVQVSGGTHPLSSGQFPGTINLVIDGQVIQSYSVDNGETSKNLAFTYSGSGSKTVSVVIVDSVLYDSSDQTTIDFSGAQSISASANRLANTVTFLWSGGSGPYDVYIDGNNAAANNCKNKNTATCTTTVSAGPHTAVVKDDDGNVSNTINF